MGDELILLYSTPAYYRIYLQGILNPKWELDFTGMSFECLRFTTSQEITILRGEVIDQAALMGVLNLLYDLRLPLLGVECFPYRLECGQ
jgi:hypothetical protein